MSDKQRKGSLAWRQNSKTGLRTRVPVTKKGLPHGYYIKVQTTSKLFDNVLHCVTVLRQVPMEKVKSRGDSNLFKINYSALGVKRTIKKDIEREISAQDPTEITKIIESSTYVDAIGTTRGKGTQGPVRVCGISLGLRKTKRGFTRRPGSMGGRKPGRVFPTKPFAKKLGNSRRTILNLKVLGAEDIPNYCAFKYFSKEGRYLYIKGSLPGTQGSTIALRPALRKQ